MAYNEKLTSTVRERLAMAGLTTVKEKKMFRGVTFMINNKMAISVGDDEIMLRIDPLDHDQALTAPGTRPMVMKGRVYRGYIFVKEKAVEQKGQLDRWIRMALEYNRTLFKRKKRKA